MDPNSPLPVRIVREIPVHGKDVQYLLDREWLVANGLGGYAAGTAAGVCTRKYHGLLVAALPSPLGRVVMLNNILEEIVLPDGVVVPLFGCQRGEDELLAPGVLRLKRFFLGDGLPVWHFEVDSFVIEKRILLPHMQNTVYVAYTLLEGQGVPSLRLRPILHVRSQESELSLEPFSPYPVIASEDRYTIETPDGFPDLGIWIHGDQGELFFEKGGCKEAFYQVERRRGYDGRESIWSPGYFKVLLRKKEIAALAASTEPCPVACAMTPPEAFRTEIYRRRQLLARCPPELRSPPLQELALAADQFVFAPVARISDETRAHAAGDEARSVVAGYPWFTDWGRDTMIGLEGLTLATGRFREAGFILRTFSNYVRDGLIPNMFPEGDEEGRYNTADATLWYFHAINRFIRATGDSNTLALLLDALLEIVDRHIEGTRFGIGVDPADGLLRQGQDGYALTWMDAKTDDLVVTPRRGKAVEINALWYNALRVLSSWLFEYGNEKDGQRIHRLGERVFESFNERFWYDDGGYLYDIVDGEDGEDDALRPNQIFAVSLDYPVLEPSRWEPVLKAVSEKLLTPYGLRTLAPGHRDYIKRYAGDLSRRDSAYHQGTVWPWLIGPFIDAWIKVYPERAEEARSFLNPLMDHLGDACIGTIGEVFDAETPHGPEGCFAQAWSVAEALRSWKTIKTASRKPPAKKSNEP